MTEIHSLAMGPNPMFLPAKKKKKKKEMAED